MLTKNSAATKRLAAKLAKRVIATENLKRKTKNSGATVVALIGDLGAGKTTFVQGFAQALGVKKRIMSPTFLIYRKYKIPSSSKLRINSFKFLVHADAYRIKKISELEPIKFQEVLADPENLVIIEWADIIKEALPRQIYHVRFHHEKGVNCRRVEID